MSFDPTTVLKQLYEELATIDDAIRALERLKSRKRRGRPPKWLSELRASATGQDDLVRRPTDTLAKRTMSKEP